MTDRADRPATADSKRLQSMLDAMRSHSDGRDLLAELNPMQWHYCNIHVRINGQWKVYEGDWLKRLFVARDPKLQQSYDEWKAKLDD